jgi:hypothetical protein
VGAIALLSALCSRTFYFFIFFSYCGLLFGSPLVNANELPQSKQQEVFFLTWLPLLSGSLKSFQADIHCPQNQISDIRVVKEKDKINGSIGLIDWDLNCQSSNTPQNSALSLKKPQIAAQLARFLTFLARLPDTEIVVKSVKLKSDQLNKKLSFNVHLNKTKQALFIRLFNESGQLTLNVDLLKRDFHLKTEFKSEKLLQYIKLPEAYRPLINGSLTFSYAGDLNKWEEGQFVLTSSGEMTPLAEKTVLKLAGDINILSQQLNLQKMDIGLSKVNYALTNNSLLKAPYVQLTLSKSARINLSKVINIQTLPVDLRIGGGSVQTKIEPAKNPDIKLGSRTHTQKFPALRVKINALGNINDLHADWSASLINSAIAGSLKYKANNLTVNIKKGQLSAPAVIDGLQTYLPEVQNWSVDKGTINYQLNGAYNLQTKSGYLKSSLQGQNIEGQKDTLLFTGLAFNSTSDFELKNATVHIKQGKQQLTLDNLFVGVPIEAIQINAHSSAGVTVIDDFKARLLDGEVTLENLKLQPQSSSAIHFSGLSLSEIIKYSAYPAISAIGLLDGVLPLTLTSEGVNVEKGVVVARAPGGYIKIPQDDVVKKMARTQPAFAFTLRLLSDFQFDSLQGRIGYTADGEMDINAEIHGMSPDVSGKQPVKFNYTHSENILKLLESLRFSDQLTRQIQEKY